MPVLKIANKAQNYVPSIAFVNELDLVTYSFSLSQAASAGTVVVSTFYSTAAFDVATQRLHLLNGSCAVGRFSPSFATHPPEILTSI